MNHLISANNVFNNYSSFGGALRLMGRKFESERAIYWNNKTNLRGITSSGTGGYDLEVSGNDSIQFIEVKWARNQLTDKTINQVVARARTKPLGTFLLEANRIDDFTRSKLISNGGREID